MQSWIKGSQVKMSKYFQ